MGEHPSSEVLERFLRGGLEAAERRQVVEHLLGGCGECARGMAPLAAVVLHPDRAPLVGGPELEESYHGAVEKAFAAVRLHGDRAPRVKRDKAKALEGLRKNGLKGVPPAGSRAGLLEAALERARELRRSDPSQAALLLGLAATTAQDLVEEGYSAEQVADFQARAAGELANSLRILHRPLDAEKWLGKALEHAQNGTGDPWLDARLLDLLGSLEVSRYKYSEALAVLEEAHNRYRSLGDRHLAGKMLVQMGMASGLAGFQEQALTLLDKGASMIHKGREPQLVGIVLHNRLYLLVDSRQFQAALALLLAHREEIAGLGGGKLVGIEGRIYAGLEHFDMAEDAFRQGKLQLLEAGDPAHAGILSLDLAALLMQQGRTAEGRAEAEQALATYRTLEIEPEARKALSLLAEALRSDLVTAAFLEGVVTFLRRLEHQPWLRFTPGFA